MRPILLLLLVGLAGCGSGTEPVTEASASGVWVLRTVNGSPLPFKYGSVAPAAVQPTWAVNQETLTLTASQTAGQPGKVEVIGTWQQTGPVTTAPTTYRYLCDWKLKSAGRLEIYPRGATNVIATANVTSAVLQVTWRAGVVLNPRDVPLEFSKQ